nr:hypothetical protein DA06_29045 [Georgenia sp. SUBG003]
MLLLQLQFDRVLDGDDSLALWDKDDNTLSSVVFPVPVPPETMILRRASTQACSSSAISGVRCRS